MLGLMNQGINRLRSTSTCFLPLSHSPTRNQVPPPRWRSGIAAEASRPGKHRVRPALSLEAAGAWAGIRRKAPQDGTGEPWQRFGRRGWFASCCLVFLGVWLKTSKSQGARFGSNHCCFEHFEPLP